MNVTGIYSKAVESVEDLVRGAPGIGLGFHSVIDGLIETDTEKLQRILNVRKVGFNEPPMSIETFDDFLKGYLYAFANGKAIQIMITREEAYREIMSNFGSGKLRLGGTSANMAVALASFGFPKVLVYANPLTKELAGLFPNLPNLKTISKDGRLGHPRDVWDGEGIMALHWIFEFKKGQRLTLDGRILECPRDNRFIASWNPVNSKLKISSHFKDQFPKIVEDYPKFIVAGFHIMRDVYPDGETVEERLQELAEFLKSLKDSGVSIHVELASIRFPRVRKGVLEMVLPVSDSVGMNEVELSWFAEDLGIDHEDEIIKSDPESVLKALRVLRDRTGLSRIHFHTLGYYMVLSERPEEELVTLAISALAAAVRAETGTVPRFDEIDRGMRFELSEFGMKAMERLSNEPDVAVLPTRIVPNPKITVGLGDTISSIAFALWKKTHP